MWFRKKRESFGNTEDVMATVMLSRTEQICVEPSNQKLFEEYRDQSPWFIRKIGELILANGHITEEWRVDDADSLFQRVKWSVRADPKIVFSFVTRDWKPQDEVKLVLSAEDGICDMPTVINFGYEPWVHTDTSRNSSLFKSGLYLRECATRRNDQILRLKEEREKQKDHQDREESANNFTKYLEQLYPNKDAK